jgi:formylglycine-generating enzyme required for sulfatase activity
MQFVKIAPGDFMMGCSPGDTACRDDEKPPHHVRITKGFEISKYLTTQAQWTSVMGNNPSHFKGDDLPVENVSWEDAQRFLQTLNSRNVDYRYRLPTEAEWEYAARAGTAGKLYGPSIDNIAWTKDNSSNATHPVGLKQPNAWGLYDMLGDVRTWVQDWFDPNYYSASPMNDPAGPPEPVSFQMGSVQAQGFRAVRGGASFDYDADPVARVSYRNASPPKMQASRIGLRCVRQAN